MFGRAWVNYNTSQTSTGLQEDNSSNREARERPEYFYSELREFYVRRNLLGDDPRYSLTVGRQSYSDRYGIWWDDTFESVRFNYQDANSSGFLAAGKKFYYYNTDINTLDETDEAIVYAMGEYAWRWTQGHTAGVRMLYENDYSDSNVNDRQDFTGLRAGLFFEGQNLDLAPLSDYHLARDPARQHRQHRWQWPAEQRRHTRLGAARRGGQTLSGSALDAALRAAWRHHRQTGRRQRWLLPQPHPV
ncbi:hypothetical protein [Pseudomonas sp. OHS18]|uniref:hypothetical protein n=1 Tax=Pseudomonas sp. OHS18 TaxID=3399679 RepID=UPI003A88C0D2